MNFNTDIFTQFDKKWALLTAGTPDNFNTMTVSWGGMGTLWGVPVVTTYVRTSRYTHEFMDNNDYFTLSFYPEDYKKILGVMGSQSGRDIDKMHYEGLTSKEVSIDTSSADKPAETVTFNESEITLVCKKLFKQPMDLDKIPADIVDRFYTGDAPHDMYIGEVVDIVPQ